MQANGSSLRAAGDDINSTWDFLVPRMERLFNEVNSGITSGEYMAIYTAIYNHCQRRAPANERNAQVDFTGGLLYQKLCEYLDSHVQKKFQDIFKHNSTSLLAFYTSNWSQFTTAAKHLHNMFSYLNRHWIKRQNVEDTKTVLDVYTLCLSTWKEQAFSPFQTEIIKGVLKVIENQRNGEAAESSQIKLAVDSLVAIGFDPNDQARVTLEVYRNSFEIPFKKETTNYYVAEAQQFLSQHSVTEYMKKAEDRIKEEEERVEMCLHPSSLAAVQEVCEEALISRYSTNFTDEFQTLLDCDRISDMRRMVILLSRIKDGHGLLREKFESHVRAHGLAAMEAVAQEGGENLEPKIYIEAILTIHAKFAGLVVEAFNGDPGFAAALDKACREFVNRNKVSKKNPSSKTPEMLARYCDALLKKGSKLAEDADSEDLLTKMMIVFKYIEDKDVFQKFYSQFLARRLVNETSASDDLETSMIGKLKESCGFEYTSKLQKMFTDMSVSKELNDGFKELHSTSSDSVDINVLVLGSASWPFKAPTTTFNLPRDLSKPFERFKHYYIGKHNNRKLTMLWQHCKGEVKAVFATGNKTGFIFQVSTYQMAILLLFNDADTLDHSQISSATALASEFLYGPLYILVKAKVLLINDGKNVGDADASYTLNKNFKSKKIRMNLNLPVKSETKQEAEETHKVIDEDRKMYIQAAMVRIMKARKTMMHVALVNETITQLSSRFTPVIADIKKCIELLIEKEYLQRDSSDRQKFNYLA